MNLKKIALATATGAALFAAIPAFANGWDHRHHARYYRAPAYGYYPARPVVVVPAPVYYVRPAPVYYAPPAPVYYAPPRPVIYGQFPVGHNGRVSIGLGL